MKIFPVILAGGSGTRLWPVSRPDFPKQFISLTKGEDSLFQLTYRRIYESSIKHKLQQPLIITNEEYRFTVSKLLSDLGVKDAPIILEPIAKNTAPAVALAAHYIRQELDTDADSDSVMLVLPSDAYISAQDHDKFIQLLDTALQHCSGQGGDGNESGKGDGDGNGNRVAATGTGNKIGTFGIKPTFPHTGYGYINVGETEENGKTRQGGDSNPAILHVRKFVEKPAHDKAQEYIATGNYYWNSGMFALNTKAYLQSLQKLAPQINQSCESAIQAHQSDNNFVRPDMERFSECPADSIDYAVMEKEADIFLVPMDIQWSDVGSWQSLADLYDKDANNNSTKGDAVLYESKNSFAFSSSKRLLTALGVEDLVIVDTPDALLVANKNKTEEVKVLVQSLKEKKYPQVEEQYRTYRPWGWYESLIMRQGFQVKRLGVSPGSALSLQSHKHRSEHWVVVRGVALVTKGEEKITLHKNESIYLPLGCKHRLENEGAEFLEIIEVQSGDYLGEDDIIRYEDIYKRT